MSGEDPWNKIEHHVSTLQLDESFIKWLSPKILPSIKCPWGYRSKKSIGAHWVDGRRGASTVLGRSAERQGEEGPAEKYHFWLDCSKCRQILRGVRGYGKSDFGASASCSTDRPVEFAGPHRQQCSGGRWIHSIKWIHATHRRPEENRSSPQKTIEIQSNWTKRWSIGQPHLHEGATAQSPTAIDPKSAVETTGCTKWSSDLWLTEVVLKWWWMKMIKL